MSDYTDIQVNMVSKALQKHMQENNIEFMTADECATFLSENNILQNDIGPVAGFNFRQMLRDGRDGIIPLVQGAKQKRPRTRWYIYHLG